MKSRALLILLFLFYAVFLAAEWRAYDVYRCGAKGLAMAGAFTAVADDVSAVYYNPAGLVQTKKFAVFYTFDSQIRIITLIDPTLKLTYKVPALLGMVYPFKDAFNTVLTIAVLSPFQRKIPNEFAMYKFTPGLAMQVLPFLSAGVNIGIDYATYGPAGSPDGWGFDFQLGLLYTPSRIFHAGLSYNSTTSIDWGTHGRIASLKETFPDILRGGVAVLLTPKLVSSFDIEFQNWRAIRFIEDGVDTAPYACVKNALFKTFHPHAGIMFLEESSGAHLRTGFYTDSYIEKVREEYVNRTQFLWSIGIGAYAFKILKVEAALSDSYLTHFLFPDNNRIETVQITVEYRF